ncbi:hypothetical protein P167DRAFT_249549 [Morchella conica CCBAS932]|uniref:Uncharacterized protein n=1 Tax=Morchella conica CCBAS932 TaxID=1392247 RepID=A0A3N4KJ48_9PEZI|nr:hypothetical protein P167DRAFT_249549 [Morchella conica CCBAS932]
MDVRSGQNVWPGCFHLPTDSKVEKHLHSQHRQSSSFKSHQKKWLFGSRAHTWCIATGHRSLDPVSSCSPQNPLVNPSAQDTPQSLHTNSLVVRREKCSVQESAWILSSSEMMKQINPQQQPVFLYFFFFFRVLQISYVGFILSPD